MISANKINKAPLGRGLCNLFYSEFGHSVFIYSYASSRNRENFCHINGLAGFSVLKKNGRAIISMDSGSLLFRSAWYFWTKTKGKVWKDAHLHEFNAQILEYTIRHGFDLSQKEALGDEPILATTKDNRVVSIEGSILFKIDKANAPELWEQIGDKFVSKVVRPYSRSRVASIISLFDLKDIGVKRTEIEKLIKEELNKLFSDKAIVVENVLFSEVKEIKGEAAPEGHPVLSLENTNAATQG